MLRGTRKKNPNRDIAKTHPTKQRNPCKENPGHDKSQKRTVLIKAQLWSRPPHFVLVDPQTRTFSSTAGGYSLSGERCIWCIGETRNHMQGRDPEFMSFASFLGVSFFRIVHAHGLYRPTFHLCSLLPSVYFLSYTKHCHATYRPTSFFFFFLLSFPRFFVVP